MLYNQLKTEFCICVILLHTVGVTICATIVPDIKPTPPFEFPSDGSDGLRILQVSDNNKNNYPFIYHENNDEITTAEPSDDNKPTPPLEFPSDGHMVKIVQASDTKLPFVYNVTNDEININKSTTQLQVEMKKKTCDGVLKSISQPINVITTVSENYTNNYIENKFYNNRAEDSRIKSSVTFTLLVLMIMAVIVLVSSAVCLKMVVNKKILKRQLLIEDCDDSALSDLIHVQHV